MYLLLIVAISGVLLLAAYRAYGPVLARLLRLDPTRPTPAVTLRDDVDFEPIAPRFLMGQHFSAIAAAGPIAGPIIAAQMFGWAPCILWIAFGVVFIGAVHDFSALVASVRHEGESVAEIARRNIGRRAFLAVMGFIWLALIYVIVAFTDITASTFVGKTEEFEGGAFKFNPGGAVAFASTAYLLLSIVMGLVERRFKPKLWVSTIIFVPLTLFVVWLGTKLSTILVLPFDNAQKAWGVGILVYCFVASLLPVWLLLQPRGYLGGFVLYIAIGVGVIGILFGGLRYPGEIAVHQPAFKTFDAGGPLGSMFPFLFVTIACGACSGFHGLVCSGTTSKQIEKESHTRPVGYGAMLLEAFVALIALSTFMIVAADAKVPGPGKVYGDGIGRYMTVLVGKDNYLLAATFGAMAFSTFVFDTLDVSARLGRYVIQELFGWKGRGSAVIATALTLLPPAYFIVTARAPAPGVRPAYMDFWTLFGTSNQLLAALTLLGVTVWLKREKRRVWYTFAPMLFVMGITVWALVIQVRQNVVTLQARFDWSATLNAVFGGALLLLAAAVMVEALRAVRRSVAPAPAEVAAPPA